MSLDPFTFMNFPSKCNPTVVLTISDAAINFIPHKIQLEDIEQLRTPH